MNKTILLVDDDTMFSDMVSEILRGEGYTVSVEHDGATGLMRALQDHPNLIMMDFMMPHMSGVAALTQLRADTWGKTVPVLMLTNMAQTDLRIESTGPTECLLKTDWTLDALVQKIKTILA